jgi:hypothetical protein
MVPVGANGQPALVAYCPDDAGVLRLHTLQVLTVTTRGITHNVVFQDPRVFQAFGLEQVLKPGCPLPCGAREPARTRAAGHHREDFGYDEDLMTA